MRRRLRRFVHATSAPWSAPNESRFKITYPGDTLPDTKASPKWRRLPATGGGTASTAAGVLTINPANAAQSYYRWLGPYVEMKLAGGMAFRFTAGHDFADNQDFYKLKFTKTF